MKCKQHCNRFLSVLDDSHNYETAVERFIKESDGKQSIDIQDRDDSIHEENGLYSEPTNEYIQVVPFDDVRVDSDEYKKSFNKKMIISNDADQILELCDNIPSEIDLSSLDICTYPDKTETELSEKEITQKHINIGNIQGSETENSTRIIHALTELIEELDSIYKQSDDANVHTTIEFCQNRIIEVLVANGCSIVEEITSFNPTHHVTRPFSIIKNGTKIQAYLRNGVIYQEKVLLKAIVKIKE